jgi:hypothetical protein
VDCSFVVLLCISFRRIISEHDDQKRLTEDLKTCLPSALTYMIAREMGNCTPVRVLIARSMSAGEIELKVEKHTSVEC